MMVIPITVAEALAGNHQVPALDDLHDAVRNSARLTIACDPETASFKGTVLNTTGQTLCSVHKSACPTEPS